MVIECDVLVVGAGPAGSVAALYSSKHGLNTVLIERNNKIGAHANTRIDSSLDFGLTKIIKEMNLKTENLVYKSKWHSPSGRSFTLHSTTGEYYFKRGPDPDSFECSTVKKAIKNGCMLLEGVIVEEINKDGKRFDEVKLVKGAEKMIIKPDIIIAADGGISLFHRYVDKQFINGNCVAYGVTGKNFVQPDTSEIYFDAELAPGGYFYIVTCLSGISSAGIVFDSNKMKQSAGRYFDAFLSKNPPIANMIKSSTNKFDGEGHLFKLNQHTKDNLLLVGDAAGLVDPLMGYGMMPAIVSGYYAGKYSTEAIKKGDYAVLKKYEWVVRERFNPRMSYVFRRIFQSMDNKDFDLLIKMANDLAVKTNMDDILERRSISDLFCVLTVFLKNLPSSRQLVLKGFKGSLSGLIALF
jgi:digeranylgeranylglycerophospholipid reductase